MANNCGGSDFVKEMVAKTLRDLGFGPKRRDTSSIQQQIVVDRQPHCRTGDVLMADLLGTKPAGSGDTSETDLNNIVEVKLDDLPEEYRKEVERELEEEMAEWLKEKMAGFCKNSGCAIKRLATGGTSTDKVPSALNDAELTLGDSNKMRLDVDPFPVNVINFEEKKVLVRTHQADTTKGKNVIVSDEYRAKMIKPTSPEVGLWKVNEKKKKFYPAFRPTSEYLLNKYTSQPRRRNLFQRLSGYKRERSADDGYGRNCGQWERNLNCVSVPKFSHAPRGAFVPQYWSSDQQYSSSGWQWQNGVWLRQKRGSEVRVSDAIVFHDLKDARVSVQQRWVPRSSIRPDGITQSATSKTTIAGTETAESGKCQRVVQEVDGATRELMQIDEESKGKFSSEKGEDLSLGAASLSIKIGSMPCNICQAAGRTKFIFGSESASKPVVESHTRCVEANAVVPNRMVENDRQQTVHGQVYVAGSSSQQGTKQFTVGHGTENKCARVGAGPKCYSNNFSDQGQAYRV